MRPRRRERATAARCHQEGPRHGSARDVVLQDLVFGRIGGEDVLVRQDDGRRQVVPGKWIWYAVDGDSVADGWRASKDDGQPRWRFARKGDMPGL